MQHEEGGRNKEEGRRKAEDERREMGEHILDRVLLLYESFARKPGWRFTARFSTESPRASPRPGRRATDDEKGHRKMICGEENC